MKITSVSSTHTYNADSEVNFFLNDSGALSVTIDTERLHIRSVEDSEADCEAYVSLFGDPVAMSKFKTGQTIPREEIEILIKDVWAKRWQQNNPYSALAAFKNDTDEFLGHVVFVYGGAPGVAELGYLFMKNYWGKGFGSEAATAVVKEYAPATIEEGYTLDGKPLEKINATARLDNLGSMKILEKLGMRKLYEEEKYEAMRAHYSIDISELQKLTRCDLRKTN